VISGRSLMRLNVSRPASFLFSSPGPDLTSQHNRKPVPRLAQRIIDQIRVLGGRPRLGVPQELEL
jgi:hypothetical protein